MGASRDLTIAVFVEATLVLSLAVAALVAGHDRPARRSSRAPPAPTSWSSPRSPLAAVAFALVVVAETGRQPVDNPDTHLELTMIHEGPLLEYARPRPRATSSGRRPRGTGSCSCSRRRCSCRTRPSSWWQLAVLPVVARRPLRRARR